MMRLRLIVPAELTPVVVAHLRTNAAVAHLTQSAGAALRPCGDVVVCDVAREATHEIVEWLQRRGLHHGGAISIEPLGAVISDAAAQAEAAAPGHGGDALIWEEIEAHARRDASMTPSFLVFMAVAATIAVVGLLSDSPILLVGAMVVGPEYGPLAALCVAATRRRGGPAGRAATTLVGGLGCAAVAALVATLVFRVAGVAPDGYTLSDRQLTAFVSKPDVMAGVVAVLAGIVGMLSLTQARIGALIGVVVSVTTIPAVANMGAAAAYREWNELAGASAQLGVNVAALIAAGVATLVIQTRLAARDR